MELISGLKEKKDLPETLQVTSLNKQKLIDEQSNLIGAFQQYTEKLENLLKDLFRKDKKKLRESLLSLKQQSNLINSVDYYLIKLSNREREVAIDVAKGLSNKQVAEKLFVTEKTIKFHLTNIYQKLEVKSRAQLIVLLIN